MKKIICLACGGNLEVNQDLTVGKCPYCLTQWVLKEPLNDEGFFKYQIATEYQKTYRFSDAKRNFEDVARQNPSFYEAWWGAFLADYGIEFGVNRIGEKVPTCHRTNTKSIYENENFKNALFYADNVNKQRYTQCGERIEETRLQILEQVNDGEIYDVFICFKATEVDDPSRRTIDYELGTSIYDNLTKNGYKVFFSAKTLLRVQEQNFEPYIYKALSTAKVMLVLCSSNKKIESAWVKNEWGRYLDMYNGKGLVPICGNRLEPYSPLSLPYDLQRLNAIVYDENVLENILVKVDSFFPERARQKQEQLDKERENSLLKENERIKRELEEIKQAIKNNTNQQVQTVINQTPIVNNVGYDFGTAIKRCYDHIAEKQYEKAKQLVDNSLLFDSKNEDLHFIKFLVSKNVSNIEDLKDLSDYYEESDEFKFLIQAIGKIKSKIINHEKYLLDKILDCQKEFAEKSKIKNGELISFDRTNLRNNDIVMIGDIKTIKDRAFYAPVAVNKATESLTICNGVEKIESCAFVTNMSKNIYIPKSVTSIETSSFYANNQSGAVLHFEIQRESRKESFARCGEFSPTGYKFGAGEYRIYKAQDNSKSPIIKKLDFILSNFNELKDYYQAEKQKILKIINENTQKLLEKEKQEFDVELKKSEEVLTEIFKLRKEFLEKAVIENGKLVEYKSSYDKEQVVYFTEDVNSFEKGLFHCYHNVKIILPSTITKLEKKSFVNNRNLELYIPKSVISLDTEAVAVYMYKGAKSLTLSFEESPYQNGFQKDYCFVSQGVVEKPKISKKGYVRNELEYYKKINPKLYNQLKNEEDRFRSELERKKIEAKLEEERKIEERKKRFEEIKNQGFDYHENAVDILLLKYTGNETIVTIPKEITAIKNNCFDGCNSVKEIIVPEPIKEIYESAFAGCKNLKKVQIADSVDFVGSEAFRDCVSLETVILPKNLETLNNGLFKNCKSLKEITLENINAINDRVFENCTSLKKVIFNNLPTYVYEKIFFGCNNEIEFEINTKEKVLITTHWNKNWNVIATGFMGIPIKLKVKK